MPTEENHEVTQRHAQLQDSFIFLCKSFVLVKKKTIKQGTIEKLLLHYHISTSCIYGQCGY